MSSTRVVVLDFANETTPLPKSLGCLKEADVVWVDLLTPDQFRQRLSESPRTDIAIIALTEKQSRWLLRTLQVNQFQFEMEKERRTENPLVREFFGAFVAMHKFCLLGGSGVVVADFYRDQHLDAHAYGDLNFGPSREIMGSVNLAFISRNAIGAIPFSLLRSPAKFGFVTERSDSSGLTMPPEWRDLEFSTAEELKRRVQREFDDAKVQADFLDLCGTVFPRKEHAMFQALHSLRLCRRMVTWTLEGSPFRCTIFIGDAEAYTQKTTGVRNEIAPLFAPSGPIPFDFDHLSDVRDLAEMIQSDALLLYINADDGCMHNISAHQSESVTHEHYWLEKYAGLTSDHNCLVIHMRGGHFVELYGRGELRLSFDGYAWQMSPYSDLETVCKAHFRDGKCPRPEAKVSRLMQVIPALLDEQKSAVLLLLNKNDEDALRRIVEEKALSPLRPKIANWFGSVIDRLPMSALEGILKLDGSHVIDHQGKLRFIAQKIGDNLTKPQAVSNATVAPAPADNEGTGTRAARNLSASLPSSFVIKVSASGSIKIFKNGEKFSKL